VAKKKLKNENLPAASKYIRDAMFHIWYYGKLEKLLLREDQLDLLTLALDTSSKRKVFHCSRRYGKTYVLLSILQILCRKKDPILVRYAAQTQKAVEKMVMPILREIHLSCPHELQPLWIASKGLLIFPNKSEIHIAGADEDRHIDRLRGTGADIYVVDEASYIRNLKYLINDVLHPQTLTTNGFGIISSSSPRTPAHAFCDYIRQAQERNSYIKKTIYDNKSLSELTIAEYAEETGGIESTTFRREYLCDLIVDETAAICPEFYRLKDNIVISKIERPDYYEAYESADLGVVHNTHVLFAYWDFLRSKLVVERELVFNYKTTTYLADQIKKIEQELGYKKIYKRISDTDLQIIMDLNILHKLNFIPTQKDDLRAQVNAVRVAINRSEIEIHDSCRQLISDLEFGIWDDNKKKFEEKEDGSHCDGIAALIYLYRNIDKNRNPYPIILDKDKHYVTLPVRNDDALTLSNAFRRK
jgi:hypothetical protein